MGVFKTSHGENPKTLAMRSISACASLSTSTKHFLRGRPWSKKGQSTSQEEEEFFQWEAFHFLQDTAKGLLNIKWIAGSHFLVFLSPNTIKHGARILTLFPSLYVSYSDSTAVAGWMQMNVL
jgi:hypothetical protein